MGERGRRRAREAFDWPVVLKSYRDLWGELAERRGVVARGSRKKTGGKTRKGDKSTPSGWPARPDPFQAFAGYPTSRIGPQSRISRGHVAVEALAALRRLAMIEFAKSVQPPPEVVDKILNALPLRGEITVAEIHSSLNLLDLIPVIWAIAWLGKMGAVKIIT